MSDPLTLKISHGALTEVPKWENHARGKNWWAKIAIDPTAPGGLKRVFANKARGDDFFYLVPDWCKPGTPVEFAGDYISGGGKRSRDRMWGVITEVHSDRIALLPSRGPKRAVKEAEGFQACLVDSAEEIDPYGLREVPLQALLGELKRREVANIERKLAAI